MTELKKLKKGVRDAYLKNSDMVIVIPPINEIEKPAFVLLKEVCAVCFDTTLDLWLVVLNNGHRIAAPAEIADVIAYAMGTRFLDVSQRGE